MRVVLTDREAEFMDVLWESGDCTVAQVKEQLSGEPAYTTVLTILRNLESKGYVRHVEEGRAHRFAARVGRDAARRSALRDLSRKLFKGSAALLMTQLVEDSRLNPDEVRRIKALLKEYEQP